MDDVEEGEIPAEAAADPTGQPILDRFASRAEARIESERERPRREASVVADSFARLWSGFWEAIRHGVGPETWARLAPLAGGV